MNIINQINELISAHPRSWIYEFKNNVEMMQSILPIQTKYSLTIQGAVYCLLNDFTPICKYNNIMKFTWMSAGFSYCGVRSKCQCNSENSANKAKITNKELYGNEVYTRTSDYRSKAKNTNRAKFGVDFASANTDVRRLAEETCERKYGTKYPSQLSEFKEKAKETKIERYGDGYFNNKPKAKISCERKYGVSNPAYCNMRPESLSIISSNDKFIEFITNKTLAESAFLLRLDNNTIRKYVALYDCNSLISKKKSKFENIISDYISSLGITFVANTRSIIAPLELDFYLPDYNIAIEINGNYWHSEISGNKDRHYHFNKWKLCREKGIDLYSYFEDELLDNIDIIKSKLNYLVKKKTIIVGARKCTLHDVSPSDERKFLNQYHIQGQQGPRNKTIGAYYDNALVAVFSYSKRKKYLEITRYACDSKASYPGLFSKMMKQMIQELNYSGEIVSFSNNGHSNGAVYKASGFTIDKILGGAYWYMINYYTRENRQKYMKTKIQKRFNINMNDKTEWQAMQELGYDRIWDSGKIKWSKMV